MNTKDLNLIIENFINEQTLLQLYKKGKISKQQVDAMVNMRDSTSEKVGHKIKVYSVKGRHSSYAIPARLASQMKKRDLISKIADASVLVFGTKEKKRELKQNQGSPGVYLSDKEDFTGNKITFVAGHELGHHEEDAETPEDLAKLKDTGRAYMSIGAKLNKSPKGRKYALAVVGDESKSWRRSKKLNQEAGMDLTGFGDVAKDSLSSYIEASTLLPKPSKKSIGSRIIDRIRKVF